MVTSCSNHTIAKRASCSPSRCRQMTHIPLVSALSPDFAALKLLVELSYSAIYTKHTWDGPSLPHDTLLRLIRVANMFEFNECIEACCEELRLGLDADVALQVVDTLSLLEPAGQHIIDLIDDAIALIGPLEDLWSQNGFYESPSEAVKNASITKLQVSDRTGMDVAAILGWALVST